MSKAKQSGLVHKLGNKCGYTLYPDGSIEPAPTYQTKFEELAARQDGVSAVLQSITTHCANISRQISSEQASLWTQICDDYGIDRDKYLVTYSHNKKRLTTEAKPAPDKKYKARK